jgi:hypothetical protein
LEEGIEMSPNIGDLVYARYRDGYGYVADKVKKSKASNTKFLYVYWFDDGRTVEYAIGSLLCNSIIKI